MKKRREKKGRKSEGIVIKINEKEEKGMEFEIDENLFEKIVEKMKKIKKKREET